VWNKLQLHKSVVKIAKQTRKINLMAQVFFPRSQPKASHLILKSSNLSIKLHSVLGFGIFQLNLNEDELYLENLY